MECQRVCRLHDKWNVRCNNDDDDDDDDDDDWAKTRYKGDGDDDDDSEYRFCHKNNPFSIQLETLNASSCCRYHDW
jgi:hypothetical protein